MNLEAPRRIRGAWIFAVTATMACAVGAVLILVAVRSIEAPLVANDDDYGPLLIVAVIAPIYAWVGALILARRPNRIGWLFCLTALGLSLSVFGVGFAWWASVVPPEPPPGAAWMAWLGSWGWVPALAVLPIVLLWFPTGSPPSKRWRPIVWAAWYMVVALTVGLATQSTVGGPWTAVGVSYTSPLPFTTDDLPIVGWLVTVSQSVFALVVVVASLIAPIWRYRGAAREERRQLRWMTVIPAALLSFVALSIAVTSITRNSAVDDVIGTIFWAVGPFVIVAAIPIAAGVAIVRHGLFDVEVVIRKAVVFTLVVIGLTGVLLVVTVALPLLVAGRGEDASSPLDLFFFLGIALGVLVVPFSRVARRIADRLVYRGRATPYQVLAEFSQRVGDTYSVDDVLPRMAQLLAAGTGAREARVWLRTAGARLQTAASWPEVPGPAASIPLADGALPAFDGWSAAFPVEHQGDLLGAITVRLPASDPIDDTKERLAREVAGQAGLLLRNIALIGDLRDSRRRIVTAQDERARKLERDIHDGAQQQLVALSVQLKLVAQLVERDPARAVALLGDLQQRAQEALEDLRDLARGIYPPLLADQGLAAALTSQARKAQIPVTVSADGIGRFDPDVESAVYFSCLEALQNVAKYADAAAATVTLSDGDGSLSFVVTDDGKGFDPATVARGSGLQGIEDRIAALGGSVAIETGRGRGVTVRGRIPVAGRT